MVNTVYPKSIFRVYHPAPSSGHFYAELEFDKDNNCGLTLIHAKNGVPDTDNFTSICINRLYPGSMEMLNCESRYVGIYYKRGDTVFDNLDDARNCHFSITPGKSGILVNPVLKINNWSHEQSIQLRLNGELLVPGKDYKTASESDAAVIRIKDEFDPPSSFHISKSY